MAHRNRLTGSHVFVFGGTSGIGYAIANMALSNGARVTISGSTQPKVDAKVEQLRSLYPSIPASNVAGFACDLLDTANLEDNLRTVFDKATQEGQQKIDHIAFTAGDAMKLPKVKDFTPEAITQSFTVRTVAPALIAKLLSTGRYMPASDASSLTLTSGTNTKKPFPDWTCAAMIGGAGIGLMRGLAVDLKPVRVNVVVPGAIHTELLQGLLDRIGDEGAQKMKKDNSLTETFGQPEDIAEAYGYIMKDRFANGSEVTSDGGRLLVSS
jgi:NAD(P)-dependent dehydrogenase (short-subunit alcohol dehydrogenase family)